ncbi:MAG: rod shape-determining protein RodA [Alphaproteobacteria bacterium]|nr:rod shape-determining protein RodA [Alphaproteobacteria bacterium]
MALQLDSLNQQQLTFGRKLWRINWSLLVLLGATASVGFAMLYSAANASFEPWASKQIMRFGFGIVMLISVALVDIRVWMRLAYVIYGVALVLLIAVDIAGVIGMGAQRWIALGPLQLQPSEIMKIALVLALARYFHSLSIEEVGNPIYLIAPLIMVLLPVYLVVIQPDLGTAVLILLGSGAIFFVAGVRIWKFIVVTGAGIAAIPVGWQFLREYQKNRVLTFLNPERDPLGAGYHILQSKIALGSGGVVGKGFLQGTQSHLSFLPERQTDFIFTMLAEELGMVGGLILLGLYTLLLVYGYAMSLGSRSQFGRLLGMGVTTTFFLYVFINIAMVMGLIPVVGVPLPLISYGGTAMLSILFAFGLLMCVHVHRDVRIGRRGLDNEG